MAVTQSDLIKMIKGHLTDSAPKVRGAAHGNKQRVKSVTVACAGADIDADGDVVVLCPVHIDDVIQEILLANDDLDGSGTPTLTFNVGLYTDAAGTLMAGPSNDQEACYASAVSGGAAAAFRDLAFEARGIEKLGQSVWQDAGYTTREAALKASDSGWLYLAVTVEASAASAVASADFSAIVRYTNDQ